MKARRSPNDGDRTLEADLRVMGDECIGRLARILEGCGIPRAAIAQSLHDMADNLLASERSGTQPPAKVITRRKVRSEIPLAHQLVTEWSRDPRYTDEQGNARPLFKRGRQSVTTLLRRLHRSASVDEILSYLLETKTVERVGNRYRLRRMWVLLRGSAPHNSWSLRYTHATLGTAKNNLRPATEAPARFQRLAEHAEIPKSKVPLFAAEVERKGSALLKWFDGLLRSYAAERRDGEEVVWLAVALQMSQNGGDAE